MGHREALSEPAGAHHPEALSVGVWHQMSPCLWTLKVVQEVQVERYYFPWERVAAEKLSCRTELLEPREAVPLRCRTPSLPHKVPKEPLVEPAKQRLLEKQVPQEVATLKIHMVKMERLVTMSLLVAAD